jgi:hypothetical protein
MIAIKERKKSLSEKIAERPQFSLLKISPVGSKNTDRVGVEK